jgi:two-component system, chemotaxis family, response regulator Rcp1
MMNSNGSRCVEILFVEDNPGDVRLIQEILREAHVNHTLTVAEDGEVALNMLQKKGNIAGAVSPNLILLDLNLPKKRGLEVLREIKQDPQLKDIPIVILTSSRDGDDILTGYGLNINAYVTKPVNYDQFLNAVNGIVKILP